MQLRRGQIVEIEFLDHCADSSLPLRFVVYGKLACVTPQSLTVACWMPADEKPSAGEVNTSTYLILRSAIMKITHLKPM